MNLAAVRAGCLILTCIVVHTCVRIELLNATCGYYLPRTDFGSGNRKWRVASEYTTRLSQEMWIAQIRQADFHAANPDRDIPDESEFNGPPYSKAEQASIDAALDDSQRRAALARWVSGMGLLQYVLAPAALLCSLRIVFSDGSMRGRLLAWLCGLSNLVCIALMIYRGYWSSLGW